jgi:hypothetical protein
MVRGPVYTEVRHGEAERHAGRRQDGEGKDRAGADGADALGASDNGWRRAQAAMTAVPGERGDGPYGDSEPGTPERHPGV